MAKTEDHRHCCCWDHSGQIVVVEMERGALVVVAVSTAVAVVVVRRGFGVEILTQMVPQSLRMVLPCQKGFLRFRHP